MAFGKLSSTKQRTRPLQHNFLRTTQVEPEAGSYWMVKKRGEDWPVVICDEYMVQELFKEGRPANARQADGIWCKDLRGNDNTVGQKLFPALYLGTMRRTWAPWYTLEEISTQMAVPIRETTSNTKLAAAWDDVNKHCGEDLTYWKQRFNALHLEKDPNQTSSAGDQKKTDKRKRKGTPAKLGYPPGYTHEEVDDDAEALFLPKAPKIKQEITHSFSAEEMSSLYEDPDAANITKAGSTPKRKRLDTSGRFTARLATPDSIHSGPPTPMRRPSSKKPSDALVDENAADPNKVMIYVGNPHSIFKVKRSGLAASPLLSSLLVQQPKNDWYIMSPLLSSIDPKDFSPIAEYIERGEYDPNLLDEDTDYVRLEGSRPVDGEGHEVVRCGIIYSMAQTLVVFGLQDLAFRKLKALKPFSAAAILFVIEAVFENGKASMRQFLEQYLADHYWEIVLEETARVAKLMKGNEDLAKMVFGRLSGLNTPDERDRLEAKVEAKMETGVKEERISQEGVDKTEKSVAVMVFVESGQRNTNV